MTFRTRSFNVIVVCYILSFNNDIITPKCLNNFQYLGNSGVMVKAGQRLVEGWAEDGKCLPPLEWPNLWENSDHVVFRRSGNFGCEKSFADLLQ